MTARRIDLGALALLVVLPLVWLNRVLVPGVSGKTMLPWDNLYAFEPFHSMRPEIVPYNSLISDLVLESTVWELALRANVARLQLPLWNPQVMSGLPLLADPQSAVLYPLDLALMWLPIDASFAWYTALHFSLAGAGMYVFGRLLGMQPLAALVGGVAFMFSGFLVTSATFPQVLGAAAWFPWLLVVVEAFVQRRSIGVWLAGVLIVTLQFLAGHPEISLYGLAMVAAYAAIRVLGQQHFRTALGLVGILVLGTALAAIQLLPTYEAITNNARVGARSAEALIAVAWPLPQLWTLLLPDLFGNPTHHQWLDLWSGTWQTQPEPIFWGTKNYVEAGQYVGITTLMLAVIGLLRGRRRMALTFGAIALVSVLLVLGSPIYLLLQAVPGVDQLRSPFRAIFPWSVAVCVLAGLGADTLLRHEVDQGVPVGAAAAASRDEPDHHHEVKKDVPVRRDTRKTQWIAVAAMALGGVAMASVALSLVWPEPFFKLAQRFVTDPAWAERAFGKAAVVLPQVLPTPSAFWGYESLGLLRLGIFALAAGLVVLTRRPALAIALIALDLFSVHGSFLPATDTSLAPWLNPRPPVIAAIDRLEAESTDPWRFTTFERGDEKTLLANSGMYFGWSDIRGYDSIVPRWYAQFTARQGLTPSSLTFNRIAPVYDAGPLRNGLLNLLNVKYVLTEQRIDEPAWTPVYRDEHIAAYRNANVLPRSFVAPLARVARADQQPLDGIDPRDVVYVENEPPAAALSGAAHGTSRIAAYGANEVSVEATADGAAWLVLADAWSPGWRASAMNTDTGQRIDLDLYRAYGTLRAVWLPGPGTWQVTFNYWPDSLRLGTTISAAVAALVAVVVTAAWLRSRRTAWAGGRSAPSRPLHAPYSPAGRGA